ncbi:DUF805 domain-containing protein [Methylobacterium sp. Leaf466]|uniref:DUF805 domain-containing protein n=1 Tax=Methylobacterium sp. Leaf466 TaxID=1736386 RepID=UPI0006FD6269|nr:DUF805 domain-containing protein [Methylobacterium sp. Leaf466]KQT88721.1 hypothetical protein ASG59_15125 [Methylobacterium sp. Leaf466]
MIDRFSHHRLAAAFDPRPRIGARAFRRHMLRSLLAVAVLLCLAVWLAGQGWRGPAIAAAAGLLPLALTVLARTAGRLRDRDRSPWWLAAYGAVALAGFAPIEDLTEAYPLETLATALAMAGFELWFLVETWLRPGTPGPNRYGRQPDEDGPPSV